MVFLGAKVCVNLSDACHSRITRRDALLGALALGVSSACGNLAEASETIWKGHKQIGPFVCRSTFPIEQAANDLQAIRGLENELRRVLATRACRETVDVLLLRNSWEHERFIKVYHPQAPKRRALYAKQGERATVYVYQHKELAIDLRHECTHALLHQDLPMVPLWLDEGIAEYFEPAPLDRPRGPSHLGALRWDLRLGRMRTLSELETKYELRELRDIDIRFSWAWTHFMLHGPQEASNQLWQFFSSLRKNEPPGLLSERLARNLGSLEDRFKAHFKEWPKVLQSAAS